MGKMHADELDTSADLARRLIARQMPQWSGLDISAVTSTGTSNAMFRLGDDLVIRLPLQPGSKSSVEKEHQWLPKLAPQLPLPIPVALAAGEPIDEYPMPWSVCRWLRGTDGTDRSFDQTQTAYDLAHFLLSLQEVDTTGGPESQAGLSDRGAPLANRAQAVRLSIEACAHHFDPPALHALWDDALAAPTWDGPPVWIHGDIASGNLLFIDGRLSAVIDWSPMSVGDPACEYIAAWEMFDDDAREIFRVSSLVDDATWRRARGWALSTATMALPYYEHTNQFMFDQAVRKLNFLLGSESGQGD